MKTNYFIISSLLLFTLIINTGCTHTSEEVATISVNSDSEYLTTFEELHLGILFDFNFTLHHADNSWVNLWVERYIDGEKETQPLIELTYGSSPNDVEEGPLGFGIINTNLEDPYVFLYGPAVRIDPLIMKRKTKTNVMSSWDYAIGDQEVELEVGETKLLAAYRETESNSMHTVDLQDEDSINQMIKQDNMVLLLKLKIEEKN